jgi:hypothetical protein
MIVPPHGVDRVVAGLENQFIDVLMERQPVGTKRVPHSLFDPGLDSSGFPVRPAVRPNLPVRDEITNPSQTPPRAL